MSVDRHRECTITYPRCDGAIDDIAVRLLGVCVVFKLGFRGEDGGEEPVEELAITATSDTLARYDRMGLTIRTRRGWGTGTRADGRSVPGTGEDRG